MSFLAPFWFFVLFGVILLFVALDGADLGIGVLSLLRRGAERSRMLDTIGPTWYADETWLVIGGAILFAAFPTVYGLVLSSMYVPAMALLFGLVLRAASTQFRGRGKGEGFWDAAVGIGCLVAVLGLGLLLGGLLGGIQVEGGRNTGGFWQWVNPTAGVTAVAVVGMVAMLGGARLAGEADDEPRRGIRGLFAGSTWSAFASFLALLALVVFRAWSEPTVLPGLVRLVVTLGLAALSSAGFVVLLTRARDPQGGRTAHNWSVITMVGVAGTLLATVFPYLVPYSITVQDAASSRPSLVFMLYGVALVIPIIVGYNVFVRRTLKRDR